MVKGDVDVLESVLDRASLMLIRESGRSPRVSPDDCILLCHAHSLPSVVPLLYWLFHNSSFDPSYTVFAPKGYSTIQGALDEIEKLGVQIVPASDEFEPGKYDLSAVKQLVAACELCVKLMDRRSPSKRNIVIFDDGGMITSVLIRMYPYLERRVISVQQTASGLDGKRFSGMVPKINVGKCAAKRYFESRVIADGVARKVDSFIPDGGSRQIGISGFGALGGALTRLFEERGAQVNIFDKRFSSGGRCRMHRKYSSCREFVADSDLIFGCVGKSWLPPDADLIEASSREYISCSSRDVEFLHVLRTLNVRKASDAPYADVLVGHSPNGSIFRNGGFPINFDREIEWESSEEIALTRGLVTIGILQAVATFNQTPKAVNIKLDPYCQRAIVSLWLSLLGRSPEDFGVPEVQFSFLRWWAKHSDGDRGVDGFWPSEDAK